MSKSNREQGDVQRIARLLLLFSIATATASGQDTNTIALPGADGTGRFAHSGRGDDVYLKGIVDRMSFQSANSGQWKEVFSDPCTADWKQRWFLDGHIGSVKTDPQGMQLTAGPEFKNDAHHVVLWTNDSFQGDLKIEYDYTRLDSETRCVNILYIQATGSGEKSYAKDISLWNELRRIPSMRTYYNHMNTYHISYAAFPNNEDATSYIRARRYMPNKTGLKGSSLEPDYFPTGLFKPGVLHRITVIKKDRNIFMRVKNPERESFFHMTNHNLPPITEGRIGLRHMFTRSSRYKDFRIFRPTE